MKKLLMLALPIVAFLPSLTFAQQIIDNDPRGFLSSITLFLNNQVVPFIFAIAFVVFIWGVFKTFILGGNDEGKQKEGKQLMMYALAGFVVMVSVWGIVNFVANGLGFSQDQNLRSIPNLPGSNN